MAIATQWVASNVNVSGSTVVYTTATSTTSPYLRDLVVNNGGTASISIAFNSGATSAATATSFAVPAGGTVILTQCQIPNASKLYAIAASGTVPVNVGYATNVAYI